MPQISHFGGMGDEIICYVKLVTYIDHLNIDVINIDRKVTVRLYFFLRLSSQYNYNILLTTETGSATASTILAICRLQAWQAGRHLAIIASKQADNNRAAMC